MSPYTVPWAEPQPAFPLVPTTVPAAGQSGREPPELSLPALLLTDQGTHGTALVRALSSLRHQGLPAPRSKPFSLTATCMNILFS